MTKAEVARTSERLAGLSLITAGAIKFAENLNLFQNGVINLDSIFHTQITENMGAGAMPLAAGISMQCNPAWTIGEFAVGWSAHLADEGPGASLKAEPPGVGAHLMDRIRAVAADIAPHRADGTLVLIGSTDPLRYHENPSLAQKRAAIAGDHLSAALGIAPAGSQPPVYIVANDLLRYASPSSPSGQNRPANLVRLLYGSDEVSGRMVAVCLLKARAGPVQAASGLAPTAGVGAAYLQGVSVGLASMAVTLAASLLIAFLAWRLLKGRIGGTDAAKPGDAEPRNRSKRRLPLKSPRPGP